MSGKYRLSSATITFGTWKGGGVTGKMVEGEEGPLVSLLIPLLGFPPRVFRVPRVPLVLQEKR